MPTRICFWTTYVQMHLITEVAQQLRISRSGAVEWLVRRAIEETHSSDPGLAERLENRLSALRRDHPMEYVRDLARRQVDNAIAVPGPDDIPY